MRKAKKMLVGLTTALAMLATLAPPAAAEVSPTVVVFFGQADVTTNDPNLGLFLPGFGPPGKQGTWGFDSIRTNTVVNPFDCMAINQNFPLTTCTIEAEGELGSVASPKGQNLGAWCGLSQGHSGVGTATPGKPGPIALSAIGWHVSAGSILPIHGHWSADQSAPNKDKVEGTVVGVVQAFGGQPCALSPTGAFNFDVAGIAALI